MGGAYRRSDCWGIGSRWNEFFDSSVGEVTPARLDVFHSNVAQEFALLGIGSLLWIIADAAIATSKLSALPCTTKRRRKDGSDKLSVAIDASHTAVHSI